VRVRSLDEVSEAGDLRWFAPAIDRVSAVNDSIEMDPGLIDTREPFFLARAPGRLDVMGGIADYSGSLVLEMPLACATFAAAQRQQPRRIDVVSIRAGRPFRFDVELERVLVGELSSAATLAEWFAAHPDDRWASYVVGSVYLCLTLAEVKTPRHGVRLFITSDVPEGKGVSSSAALEVAVMAATAACFGIEMDGVALATACQWVENHIAAAPCGIMDQMTSVLGRRDRLLRLKCQPAIVEGHVSIPAGYGFYGIDSGIRHAVTGSDYGTVRTAAFMGYRIIADAASLLVSEGTGVVEVRDDRWHGYLANISPDAFSTRFAEQLPERLRGAEFIQRYGGITDSVTRVDPERWYPVRAAASHPVHEHARVMHFADLLATGITASDIAMRMGELMHASHTSYSTCGLGSDGTDRLVELVAAAGPSQGLFGAKITGGGSGGTVAILGTDNAGSAVHHIAREYERETGRAVFVFEGSGPGAEELGVLVVPEADF
jgi:L-arabinokinase